MTLACPRCRVVELDEVEVAEVIIDRCPRCAGIWFDHAEISEIVGRQSRIRRVESVMPPDSLSEGDVRCPHCAGVFLRRLAAEGEGGRTNVVFRCVSCLGTWLDRGELREHEDAHLFDCLRDYFSKAFLES